MNLMENPSQDLLSEICSSERCINTETLNHTIILAIELAREGREGRKIGTMFVVSDLENVIKRSKCMILDPLKGHADSEKRIIDPAVRETAKELAQLDGAFLVSDNGILVSACRYINATSENVQLPLGLGSRHMAAASITRETNAVAVVVSESSIVRIFDDGNLISEIIPELWLLNRNRHHLTGPISARTDKDVTVISKSDNGRTELKGQSR